MKAGIQTPLQNRTENVEKKLTVCTDVDNQELLQNYFGVLSASLSYGICQSKINSRWVAGPIGQTNRRPSV